MIKRIQFSRITRTAEILLLAALLFVSANSQNRNEQSTCDLPQSIKVHMFEIASLENLLRIIPVMEAHKNSHGFIVTYAGRFSSLAEAQRRADIAKRQLLEKRQWINQSDVLNARLNTLVCGYREAPATELWVTPVGAAPPVCAPTKAVRERRPKRQRVRRR